MRRTVVGAIPACCSRAVASAWLAPATTGTSWGMLVAGDTAEAGCRVVAGLGDRVTQDGPVATSTAAVPATSPTTSRAASRRWRSGWGPAAAVARASEGAGAGLAGAGPEGVGAGGAGTGGAGAGAAGTDGAAARWSAWRSSVG